ncbi:MAG: heavy-metal-associated domain-containing protein [Myxococcota bacterium]
MAEHTIVVKGMTCEACVRSVRKAVGVVPGVKEVVVDLGSGRVEVRVDEAFPGLGALRGAVEDAGYDVAEVR